MMTIKLAEIFSDGMTLQREKEVRIWGNSDEFGILDVRINQNLVLQPVVERGDFEFYLPPQAAMENAEVMIGDILLKNVDFGEVWIAGGQSNMEFLLRYDIDAKETIAQANDEHLRYYCVGKYTFAGQEKDGIEDDTYWNKWLQLKEDIAEQFIAVGLYFALELRTKYQIPVAIVGCNYGGTTASAWMDKKYLTGESGIYLEEYEQKTRDIDLEAYLAANEELRRNTAKIQGEMMDALLFGGDAAKNFFAKAMEEAEKSGVSQEESVRTMELMNMMGPRHQNRPGGLYDVMLRLISGFGARGVIWYQGEADDVHPNVYGDLFSKMIRCWRDIWKEELPFLFVQLAPFERWLASGGEAFPTLRAQQQMVADTVPNVWMISSSDVGNRDDVHPKEKKPIGHRLALAAMNRVYHEDVVFEAPRGVAVEAIGNKVNIIFNGAKKITVKGKVIQAFDVSVDGESAEIIGFTVQENRLIVEMEVDCSMKEVNVCLAYTPYYEVNIYNEAGIPAIPFSL